MFVQHDRSVGWAGSECVNFRCEPDPGSLKRGAGWCTDVPRDSRPPSAMERIIKSDQPGRVLAVFVFAPVLLHRSFKYDDTFIRAFATLLFAWDLYWLALWPARVEYDRP